jgi:predicted metal-binding membrane protein
MIYNRHAFAPVRLSVLGASLAAWFTLAALSWRSAQGLPDFLCSVTPAPWLTPGWFASACLGWLLMIVAMMAPMTLPAIAHIQVSVFAQRRVRTILIFLAGFAAIWLIPGLVISALAKSLGSLTTRSYGPAALALLVAAIWQCSPLRQGFLNRCHTHPPLAAFGLRADVDALRLGLAHGLWCIGTCWAWMLLTAMLPVWHLLVMPVIAVLAYCERLDAPRRPAWQIRGLRAASQLLQREIAHARRHRSLRHVRPGAERPVREGVLS